LENGAGLYLRVKPTGAQRWVSRIQHGGKRPDIGLGGYPADLSLAQARDKAANLRKLARRGANARAERARAKVVISTFAEAVTKSHAEFKKGWSDKNAAAFKSSLELHIVPRIGVSGWTTSKRLISSLRCHRSG
jgi:hypothetical protein